MTINERIQNYNKGLAKVFELNRQLTLTRDALACETRKETTWKEKLSTITIDIQTTLTEVRSASGYIEELRSEKERTGSPLVATKLNSAYEYYYNKSTELSLVKSARNEIERELASISHHKGILLRGFEAIENQIAKELETLKCEVQQLEAETGNYYHSRRFNRAIVTDQGTGKKLVGNLSELELIHIPTEEESAENE